MSDLARPEQVTFIFEEKLERRELQLPILPRVAATVIQLATDEDADARQLANLIQGDQALAGHVMRIANSPIYRPVSAFVSLQQAIARLGIVTIGEIALATSLNADLFSAPGHEKLLLGYWHNSLLTSAWAREIARMRRTNVEESFLSGLLCQIGRPVVVQGVGEFSLDSFTVEQLVATYHVRAGALLANLWGLPAIVNKAILYHRDSAFDEPERDKDRLADDGTDDKQKQQKQRDVILTVQAAIEMAEYNDAELLSNDIQEKLNFYPEDIESLNEKRQVVDAWVETMEI